MMRSTHTFLAASLLVVGVTGTFPAQAATPDVTVVGTPRLYVVKDAEPGRPAAYYVFHTKANIPSVRLVLSSLKGLEGRVYRTATRRCYRAIALTADRTTPSGLKIKAGTSYRVSLVGRPSLDSKKRSELASHKVTARSFTPTGTRKVPAC